QLFRYIQGLRPNSLIFWLDLPLLPHLFLPQINPDGDPVTSSDPNHSLLAFDIVGVGFADMGVSVSNNVVVSGHDFGLRHWPRPNQLLQGCYKLFLSFWCYSHYSLLPPLSRISPFRRTAIPRHQLGSRSLTITTASPTTLPSTQTSLGRGRGGASG